MEKTQNTPISKFNGFKNGIIKDYITVLNLSHRNITNISEDLKLPPNLTELNISHNKLESVSEAIINLKNIRFLDVSYNEIEYFDDTPSFCHTIKCINISNNKLLGPPAWVWFDSPKKLSKLNISSNKSLTNSFRCGYFEELIKFKTSITDLTIHNCKLGDFLQFLGTFPKVKSVKLGDSDISYIWANTISELPCKGLIGCCDIERLDLRYTHIYNIKSNIDVYKNLLEINLAQNELSSLPDEFCNLECLEVCILSYNHILYLPNNFLKLKKLHTLCLDSNELCMLPVDICSLPNLKKLDLYDNYLCEIKDDLSKLQEIDLAQNYLDEPTDHQYINKKEKLRLHVVGRWEGRKEENIKPQSSNSSCSLDDKSFSLHLDSDSDNVQDDLDNENRPSSAEDWDSDEYWIPHHINNIIRPPQSPWVWFVKQKMEEGNFCPIDMHAVPVAERVNYERTLNPPIQYESKGQFDDYSSDDS